MLTRDQACRFWAKVNRDGPLPTHMPELGKCWVWMGATTNDGYGLFRLTNGATMKLAHRVSWLWAEGEWPKKNALHKCDNRGCCNPEHLFEGDQSDNMRDCSAKRRLNSARGDRSGRRLHPESYSPVRGSAHGSAKLTEADVARIRLMATEGHSQKALAAAYGMSSSSIQLICARKTWRHV